MLACAIMCILSSDQQEQLCIVIPLNKNAFPSPDIRAQLTSPDTLPNLNESCNEDFISTTQILHNNHNSRDELMDQHDEPMSQSLDTECELTLNDSIIKESSQIHENEVTLLSSQATFYDELLLQELQDNEDFGTRKNNVTQPKDLKSMMEIDNFFKIK
ncbi:hypothetical protein TKK_0015627 [Trichogramma kaykai]